MTNLVEVATVEGTTYFQLTKEAQEKYGSEPFFSFFIEEEAKVEEGEVIAEMEADKTVIDLPAPCAATIVRLAQAPQLCVVDIHV